MENKEKLLKMIEESNIDQKDKEMWFLFFDSSSEKAIEGYAEIFSSLPEEIGWFNEIMKRKIVVLDMIKKGEDNGQEEMSKIIEEEKNKLEELANKM